MPNVLGRTLDNWNTVKRGHAAQDTGDDASNTAKSAIKKRVHIPCENTHQCPPAACEGVRSEEGGHLTRLSLCLRLQSAQRGEHGGHGGRVVAGSRHDAQAQGICFVLSSPVTSNQKKQTGVRVGLQGRTQEIVRGVFGSAPSSGTLAPKKYIVHVRLSVTI